MRIQIAYKPLSKGFLEFTIPAQARFLKTVIGDDYVELVYGTSVSYDNKNTVKHKYYCAGLGDEVNPLIKIDEVIDVKDRFILFSVL